MNDKKKTILITGGTGFIGSAFQSKIADKKDKYKLVSIGRGAKENINLDLSNHKLSDVVKEIAPDIVCHFASGTNIARAEENKEKEFKDTVLATKKLLQIISKLNQKPKFIYLSSQAVYGQPEYLPVDENHSTNPTTYYGESKLQIEKLIVNSGIDYAIFRVSSVFGQNQDYKKSGVIAKFVNKLKNNESPFVFNSFDLICDFIYVNDLVKAVYQLIEKKFIWNEIVNLGSGVPVTLKEVLDILYSYFPNAPKPVLESNELYINKQHKGIYLNISKIQSLIGWKCEYNLQDALKEMLTKPSLV